MSFKSYQYLPLRPDHIRLIKLEPDDRHSPLRCSITHVPRYSYLRTAVFTVERFVDRLLLQLRLKSALSVGPSFLFWHHYLAPWFPKLINRYEALSYVWGTDERSCSIKVSDGSCIRITPTLAAALRNLSLEGFPRQLWVDSICINQADNAEKSQQVSEMGSVYECAQRTIVYLGETPNESRVVMDLIARLNDVRSPNVELQRHTYRELGLPGPEDDAWKDLRALLSQPWFTRVWVLQEVVLAAEVVLVWGNTRMDFNVLEEAVAIAGLREIEDFETPTLVAAGERVMEYDTVPVSSAGIGAYRLREMRSFRLRYLARKQKFGLVDLVLSNLIASATRSRDHLFGLLGLAKDIGHPELYPDYEEPYAQVARRFARSFVRQGHAQTILGISGLQYSSDTPDYPTWIPDFTRRREIPLEPLIEYKAAGATRDIFRVDPVDCDLLLTQGMKIDFVIYVGTFPVTRDVEDGAPWIAESDMLFASLQAAGQQYPTREHLADVQWKSMIAGQTNCDEYQNNYRVARLALGIPIHFGPARNFLFRAIWDASWANWTATPGECDISMYSLLSLFVKTAARINAKRLIALTARGYVGYVPPGTREGDWVCLVSGCPAPFVMRDGDSGGGPLRYIGQGYIHGIMHGEAIENGLVSLDDGQFPAELRIC